MLIHYNSLLGYETSGLTIGKVKLDEDIIQELLDFWKNIFLTDYESFRRILKGEECIDNLDIFYLVKKGGRIAATCHLTIAKANPQLGGLGEVCTVPEFRGKGLASTLCAMAIDDFRIAGGKALFLGTGNPAAELIYRRLGWIKLKGTNVMVFLTNGESPEVFLSGYFSENGVIKVVAGTPADRIPIIPLIVTPHDWHVLDSNLDIFSTRYVVQRSCMGLFPRYQSISANGQGEWFAARNNWKQTVGLSTVRLTGFERCEVDGFTHSEYPGSWEILINSAISWAAEAGIRKCMARALVENEEKISLFESSAFRQVGKEVSFYLEGRKVASICMELDI